VMLMVEVIFAFKKRAVDTFFLFDIGASQNERRNWCETVHSKLICKVIKKTDRYWG
jgi:imidazole glycerol phosphate synthase subunit HisF